MVAATAAVNQTPAPTDIVDFLWNLHRTLVSAGSELPVNQLKETYFKQMGHKCGIEKFLVVGAGGLGATLKRIPHIVTVTSDASGALSATNAQPVDITKTQLIEADEGYRQKLRKKTATREPVSKAAAAQPAPAATRPAEGQPPGQPEAKKPKVDEQSSHKLAKMLLQGVVRVLQNRQKDGKGPLPLPELEKEFKALWKVNFNLPQAGETDAVTFLRKYPTKVQVYLEGTTHIIALAKKAETAAAPAAAAAPAPAATTAATSTTVPAAPPAATPVAETPAAAVPVTPTAPATTRPVGPVRPPQKIEDFLWYVHSALASLEAPVPVEQFKDVYSRQMGHKLVVERFLCMTQGDMAAAFKRIPHIVTVAAKDGQVTLKATLAADATKEQLLAEDQAYRKTLQEKKKALDTKAAVPAAIKAGGAPPDVVAKAPSAEFKAKAAAPVAATAKMAQAEATAKDNGAAAVLVDESPMREVSEEAPSAQEAAPVVATTAAALSAAEISEQLLKGLEEMKALVQRQEELFLAYQKKSGA